MMSKVQSGYMRVCMQACMRVSTKVAWKAAHMGMCSCMPVHVSPPCESAGHRCCCCSFPQLCVCESERQKDGERERERQKDGERERERDPRNVQYLIASSATKVATVIQWQVPTRTKR